MAPLSGKNSIVGSYEVALTKDDDELSKATVEYNLEGLSADTAYNEIVTAATEGVPSKVYYKVVGTKLYTLSAVKQNKIHSQKITAGDVEYDWWNGAGLELGITLLGETEDDNKGYSVGSVVFEGTTANALDFSGVDAQYKTGRKRDAALISSASAERCFMALGTFDNDDDTDKGYAVLNVVDLAEADYDESAIEELKFTFNGYVGPNDGTGVWFAVDATKQYTVNGVVEE